ncbi:MAG: HAD family hydrolase [Candidatus Hodarchaeota archaeon]
MNPTWHIFFDLHGVLAVLGEVGKNYANFIVKILEPVGISRKEAIDIHAKAHKIWIKAFREANNISTSDDYDPDAFMARIKELDTEWENFVLAFIPEGDRTKIKPMLETQKAEYSAMAGMNSNALYPEVKEVVQHLKDIRNVRMHVASSASSYHIKGTLDSQDLTRFFDTLIGFDTVKAPKKAPGGWYFKKMLEITGADPNHSFFVGDSMEEAQLAMEHGLKYVMVDRFNKPGKYDVKDLNFEIIDDLSQLFPIIQRYIE